MPEFVTVPPAPPDYTLITYIGIIGMVVFMLLWKEVINPYRKRDWFKAYMLTEAGKMDVIDVKPKSEHFEYRNGTYFFPRQPFTREYKITVKKAGIYKENQPHPLVVETVDTTKSKLKGSVSAKELNQAVRAQNMKQLMTPKMPWKEQLMFAILGAFGGISIGLLLAPTFFPCPVCP